MPQQPYGNRLNIQKRLKQLGGLYISFETDTGPDVLARAFPPGHLRRLRALKAVWDPTGLFRDNFYITPESDVGDTPPARAVRLAPIGMEDQ